MIRLTRLDRREVVLNCDLIESLDASPDTTIRLVTGKHLVVREGVDEVLERIRTWHASVRTPTGVATSPVVLPPLVDALAERDEEAEVAA